MRKVLARSLWSMSVLIAVTAGGLACGLLEDEDEDEDVELVDPFLVEADILPGNIETLEQESAMALVGSSSSIYANEPAALAARLLQGGCGDEVLDAAVVSAGGENLTISIDADQTECLNLEAQEDLMDGQTITYSGARFRVVVQAVCPGSDLEGYDGQTWAQLTESDDGLDICGDSAELLLNAELSGTYEESRVDGDSTLTFGFDFRFITFDGNSAMGRCSRTFANDSVQIANDCIEVSRTVFSNVTGTDSPLNESYTRVSYTDVVTPDDDTSLWHTSGVIDLTIHDWSANLIYSGGTEPACTLARGATSVDCNLSGTSLWRPDASLGLAEGVAWGVRQNVLPRLDIVKRQIFALTGY